MSTLKLNQLYNMDCVDGLFSLPEGSVDITITSPPYNIKKDYGEFKDNLSKEEYANFAYEVSKGLFHATSEGGRVCINVPPDVISDDGIRFELDMVWQEAMKKAGFTYRTKIVWNKNQVNSRLAWGSFASPSNPNLLLPCEFVIIFYKGTPKKEGDPLNRDITKEEFIEWTISLWNIQPETSCQIDHPAPYPEELVERLLKLYSYVNDVVCDPFVGTGTTPHVAKRFGRRYVGFELYKPYYEYADRRVKATMKRLPIFKKSN